jgi:hypothetical protein
MKVSQQSREGRVKETDHTLMDNTSYRLRPGRRLVEQDLLPIVCNAGNRDGPAVQHCDRYHSAIGVHDVPHGFFFAKRKKAKKGPKKRNTRGWLEQRA